MIELTLPWPSPDLSPNSRGHWSKKARAAKAYRQACYLTAKQQGLTRIEAPRLHATIIFYPPSKRRIDLDNCIARIKQAIDAVAEISGVDDSKWTMSFSFAGDVGGMVKINLEPMRMIG